MNECQLRMVKCVVLAVWVLQHKQVSPRGRCVSHADRTWRLGCKGEPRGWCNGNQRVLVDHGMLCGYGSGMLFASVCCNCVRPCPGWHPVERFNVVGMISQAAFAVSKSLSEIHHTPHATCSGTESDGPGLGSKVYRQTLLPHPLLLRQGLVSLQHF